MECRKRWESCVSDSTHLSGSSHRNQNPGHLWFSVLNRKTTNPENDFQIVATTIFHASTLDFFLVILGLVDSLDSGEPGGSVGGLGALSTSGSGSRGIEGPLETPEKQQIQQGRLQRAMVFRFLKTDTNRTVSLEQILLCCSYFNRNFKSESFRFCFLSKTSISRREETLTLPFRGFFFMRYLDKPKQSSRTN